MDRGEFRRVVSDQRWKQPWIEFCINGFLTQHHQMGNLKWMLALLQRHRPGMVTLMLLNIEKYARTYAKGKPADVQRLCRDRRYADKTVLQALVEYIATTELSYELFVHLCDTISQYRPRLKIGMVNLVYLSNYQNMELKQLVKLLSA